MRASILRTLLIGLWIGLGTACGDDNHPDEGEPNDPGDPAGERPSFVSADARAGDEGTVEQAGNGALLRGAAGAGGVADFANASATPAAAMDAAEGSANRSDNASVVEGDIYRVLDTGTILNLNAYRGLQVIDISDPDAPEIAGDYSVQGDPEELYVRGDRAFVLLNNWRGYYGSRGDIAVERREGGLLLAIDLSEPTDPKLLDSLFIRGWIRKSRMVTDGDAAALYVVSSFSEERQDGDNYEWIESTVVTSFDVTGSGFEKRDELDLGGYVQDIQATPSALLVATNDWSRNDDRNEVSIVDISHPDGSMAMGDTVRVSGYIQSQFNMDLHEGILRVVSTNWNDKENNRVETFDASDISDVSPIDACSFGAGQDLFATLFVENKAFFVTYMRRDPFHAFEIDAEGHCQEHNEFIVSGWNDFFRPVADQTRLIGIGTNDENGGSSPAVSLYDITDLTNPEPLLARAQTGKLQWSWSEASYDHRAFSVLEGAVSVQSGDGVEEMGLVLLPFSGYTEESKDQPGQYISGVQIFTFSDTTVTARAAMEHDTEVRRSFLTSESVTANLSEQALSLFDHTDPDAPKALGSVDLAPDYGRVLAFGDYLARLHRPSGERYYEFEAGDSAAVPSAQVEIIPADADPNTTDVVTSFDVPVDARLLKAGDALVAVSYRYLECDDWPCSYDTTVQLFDLSDPADPKRAGSAKADDLSPSYVGFGGNPYFGGGGFIGCGVGAAWFSGNQVDGTFALGDAVVFTVPKENVETLGIERSCSTWPLNRCQPFGTVCETFYEGEQYCTSLDGGPEVCRGEFYACSESDTESKCDPVTIDDVGLLQEECWENPRQRYWTTYNFKVLDVSDLDEPRFGDLLKMSDKQESMRVLPSGDSLYYTYRRPTEVVDDPRPHVAYYFQELDFSDPRKPSVGAAVNIPGELIAVDGDHLFTRDLRWGEDRAESYLHELALDGDVARLAASHRFEDREVVDVVTDADRLLVSHRTIQNGDYYYGEYGEVDVAFGSGVSRTTDPGEAEEQLDRLTIFSQRGLDKLGELEIDRWSTLEAAHEGRALYSVPGGMMLFNFEQPAEPFAQAYFPSVGWPEQILFEDGEITITAGPYGIYRFAADAFNLLSD